MAVYNGARFLAAAIESVLAQTFRDFELVIVIDGATDASHAIAASYDDPRIRILVNETNQGLARSLNRGLETIRSEYVARLDADDLSFPERLSRQVAWLDSHPGVAVLGTQAVPIDGAGQRLRRPERWNCQWRRPPGGVSMEWYRTFYTPLIHSSVMFRRAIIADVFGGYDGTCRLGEDAELWTRVARTQAMANLDEQLIAYRHHPASLTSNSELRKAIRYEEHKVDFTHTLMRDVLGREDVPRQWAESWVAAGVATGLPSASAVRECVDMLEQFRTQFVEAHGSADAEAIDRQHAIVLGSILHKVTDRLAALSLFREIAARDRRLARTLLPLFGALFVFGGRRLRSLWTRLNAKRGRRPAAPAVIDASTIDLDAPEIARDPFPHYDTLRAAGPVQFLHRHGMWIVLGFDEVQWAFTRPDLLSNKPYEDVDAVLLAADPPGHTAMRRLVSPYFARDVIERLGTFAEDCAAELLQTRTLDVVAGFGRPLAEGVAAQLLGFESGEVEAIRAASGRAADFMELVQAIDAVADQAVMYRRLRSDGLDDAQARSLVRLFWVASTATSERVIAECVLALLQHPDTRTAIESDPALLAPFIEEVMRLHQPEPMLRRLAIADVELGGKRIPTGSLVLLSLAAANRDPRRHERPSELRLDRSGMRHLTFGHGIHHCIGASLGRMTVTAAVRTILTRAPRFRAAQPLDSVTHVATMMAHHIESLAIETG